MLTQISMSPLMLCYFFQYLDKTAIAYANLFDFSTANNLKGQDFAWLGSIFYIGYLVWQPFAAWLLVRVSIKVHFGCAVLAWSTCLGCMAACHNFAGLAACRFLLGCAESAMLPICGSVTGMWYTRNEQSVRVGLWYSMVGWGGIFGSIISYGMYALPPGSLRKWQFIFVLLGPLTFVYGVYVLLVVPASPARAWFLTPRERLIALERIRANKTGTTGSGIRWYQVREAFQDPRIYLAALSVFATSIPNGGVTSFSAVLIQGFGFDKRTTSLVGISTGASEILGMWLATYAAYRLRSRFWPALSGILVGIAGAGVMLGLPAGERVGRLVGLCFVYWFPIGMMLFIPWIQSMTSGATKRATFYCVYQLFYGAGNLAGGQTFRASEAPVYHSARIAILSGLCVHAATMAAIYVLHRIWNARRDRKPPVVEEDNIEFKE